MEAAIPHLIFAQETTDPRCAENAVCSTLRPDQVRWAPVAHGRWGSGLVSLSGKITPVDLDLLHGWVVGGYVETAERGFLAFSVHLPATRSSYVRTAHLLLDALRPLSKGESLILGGDWNLTASHRATIDPFQSRRDEVELMTRLASDFDLVPVWSTCHPEQPLPQTLRWTRDPTHPYHCDGIFVPAAWSHELTEAAVLSGAPWSRISDHNPVVAALGTANAGRVNSAPNPGLQGTCGRS